MRKLIGGVVIYFCCLLSLGCAIEPYVYPTVIGQVKTISSGIIPGTDNAITAITFSDGRSYMFAGAPPVTLEEGKTYKISYNTQTLGQNNYRAWFHDIELLPSDKPQE